MIQFLPVYEDNVVAFRVSGKLTHEQYQAFIPQIETQIKRYGKISVLMELDNFSGWELAIVKDDFEFGLKHRNDIERFALLGDKAWQHWMVLMSKPFLGGEIKYFDRDDTYKAWDWVRNKEEVVSSDEVGQQESADNKATVELLPYKNIVVAVDFSAHSVQATKRAAELAKHYGVKLTLLHMVEEIGLYDTYYDPIDMNLMLDHFPEFDSSGVASRNEKIVMLGKKRLQNFVDKMELSHVKTEVLSGDTASSIASYAEAQQTDLIVMGTHGRRGVSRILGSVARSVQNSVRCEVLIVSLR